jgi:hypothetical protein
MIIACDKYIPPLLKKVVEEYFGMQICIWKLSSKYVPSLQK